MDKITDEELDRIENEKRHSTIVSALTTIANKIPPPANNDALLANLQALTAILNKKPEKEPEKEIDLKPIARAITEGVKQLIASQSKSPKSFRIDRNTYGVIEKIVVE